MYCATLVRYPIFCNNCKWEVTSKNYIKKKILLILPAEYFHKQLARLALLTACAILVPALITAYLCYYTTSHWSSHLQLFILILIHPSHSYQRDLLQLHI